MDTLHLKEHLTVLLGWDPQVIDGIIEAIDATDDTQEVQEIAMNFMGDSREAISLVEEYHTLKSAQRQTKQSIQNAHQKEATTGLLKTQKKADQVPENKSDSLFQMEKGKGKENTKKAGKNQKPKKQQKSEASDKNKLPSEVMERKVVNCLSCGKIYDSRKLSEEIYRFIDSGGICNFCGAQVDLTYKTQQDQEDTRKAVEFKDRLVDYDRNSAQRTSVLDDQSDYFEIDTNVWLDEKEKRELRLRRDIEEEFAKSQRHKVHYTIDLLGRKVFVSEAAKTSEQVREIANAASSAAESTLAELPQGGGTGAKAASQTASRILKEEENESQYQFRVHSNPEVKLASPIFLPSKSALEASKKLKEEGRPAWIQGTGGRLQHDDVFAAFDEDFEPEVLSTDLSAYSGLFDDLDNGVFDLCPDVKPLSQAQLSEPKKESSVSANSRLSSMLIPGNEASVNISNGPDPERLSIGNEMPDGIILLKGWLTFEEQVMIIETVRNLGIGEGGFYTPGYGTNAKLKLKMMCLGMNWNPVNRVYEKIRSNFDGATVPPLPEAFKEIVQRCMKDANRLRGRPFTPIDPNICLCNFYAKDSLLGLHQDREEGPESLRKQIPVVSFSIGAAGEFVFNSSRAMDTAKSVLLESGDALVFGGPSRMIFHGIRKIFPESMPQELMDFTGMRTGRLNLTIRQYIPEYSTN